MRNKHFLYIAVFILAFALPIMRTNAAPAVNVTDMTGVGSITSDLSLGSSGLDVSLLQTFLEENDFLKLPANVSNGYFGALTKSALASYQSTVHLPAQGYFGGLTRNAIQNWIKSGMHRRVIPDDMINQASSTSGLNIIENGKSISNLSKAAQAFEQSGLTDVLTGDGPFTVFAPTDDAFAKIPSALLSYVFETKNASVLKSIIKYHIVLGAYTLDNLYDGEVLTTLNGNNLTIAKKNNLVTVNGKNLTTNSSVISKNGILYSIDSVLIPSIFGISF